MLGYGCKVITQILLITFSLLRCEFQFFELKSSYYSPRIGHCCINTCRFCFLFYLFFKSIANFCSTELLCIFKLYPDKRWMLICVWSMLGSKIITVKKKITYFKQLLISYMLIFLSWNLRSLMNVSYEPF